MLRPGFYEQVINKAIEEVLAAEHAPSSNTDPDTSTNISTQTNTGAKASFSPGLPASQRIAQHIVQTAPLDREEASRVLASYIAAVIQKGLDDLLSQGGSVTDQIDLVNQIVSLLTQSTSEPLYDELTVARRAEQLLAYLDARNTAAAVSKQLDLPRPQTSLARSSLFTGAVQEPPMYSELKKEILTADRVDMLVSFIKWSGLRLIIDELRHFTQNGGQLRVITTSYMGATDVKAIEELRALPNTSIKVSYDTKRTRLHAKTYVFYRDTGFTTAYVGSSNLSGAAISSGLEWNVKVTRTDLPDTLDKIEATFESYWNARNFEYYDEGQKERLARALKAEKYLGPNSGLQDASALFTFDISPYSYQQEILDQLDAERRIHGHHRNLLVAATGTGKTVISAFDYRRFRSQHPGQPCRFLFVAHREEILSQSLYTFRGILKDPNFGELFVGNHRPDSLDHLFISIQTFNARDFTSLTTADFYDYIIVDEFHHAAAPTYRRLLSYYRPTILLGLTATPERMDGRSILDDFDGRIAAEIRLPEAIDRKLLCPFQYFGVTDTIDLTDLKWSRGGYDKSELSRVYTLTGYIADRRAASVADAVHLYVTDIDEVKGLGFCVSVEHASYMAQFFNSRGIPSIHLSGSTPDDERTSARLRLVSGEIRFIFVVDLYNEGVDIPEINTILFLRPTESLTIFLQQLGRGLRLAENKDCLTVLDFIGQANRRYSFESKFAALMENTGRSVQREIKSDFPGLPRGCYIQLEKKARQHILDNIRSSFGTRRGMLSRIETFAEDTGQELRLGEFIEHYHVDPRVIYKGGRDSFARLCVDAGCRDDFDEALEDRLTKALLRFTSTDSRRFIGFLLDHLPQLATLEPTGLSPLDQRMLNMFYVTVFGEAVSDWSSPTVREALCSLARCPVMLGELISLLQFKYQHIDFTDEPVDLGFDHPLDLHCTYSRDQLLVALDLLKPSTVREGVKYLPDKGLDLFFVTLNKSDKDYSPTTMYKDYSVNEELFHWQSQSTTSAESKTGQRYIHHRELGSQILLFVRDTKADPIGGGAAAYTFLGKASYVSHQGSRPMNILWRLERPIPARFMKKTNKLVMG